MDSAKKILISGATGFIGANITRAFLKKGMEIGILTREFSNKWRIKDIVSKIKEYKVDLLDENGLKKALDSFKPDIIFHAAVYGGLPVQKDVRKIYETNLIGTINLFSACANANLELFLNFGSSSEYGIKEKSMQEDDSLEPISDYGISKALSTFFCQMKSRLSNFPVVTLRLFSPYGYYEDKTRLIPSVIISCLKGEFPRLSSPYSVRDFVFIEDVIEACFKVIEFKDKVAGQIINIGSGTQHSVKEVAEKIIHLTGNRAEPIWNAISNPRIEPTRWQADITKAGVLINWYPQFSFEEGLRKTLEWFRENMRLYEEN